MANEVRQKTGNPFSFADHAGDFAPGTTVTLEHDTPTDVQISLASLADTAARQSAKFDFGVTRAAQYSVMAAIEFAATPTPGEVVEFYLAPSPSGTAANANPGGVSGSDSAYTGDGAGTLAECVRQLMLIGVFVVTDLVTTSVQIAFVGTFSPPERYGTLVVKNEAAIAFHSDDVETHVVISPIIDEVQ